MVKRHYNIKFHLTTKNTIIYYKRLIIMKYTIEKTYPQNNIINNSFIFKDELIKKLLFNEDKYKL